ncbi:MAG: hypothetical protein G01um101448_64 [Parcubacteria group bacterium Gr01-1014_48]|nr:MAG: hypothetical protein Greene041614_146 [Parcubacteria group bacterium Greene0416_14]TSC74545.1 MAG: hypothetical protein G01um101448_64 [Parcubacteria group bacterium Gr01-1014_48]TSD01421.1 MAG: hypothetical protein Greene101415_268 [Parcubacteria group bacterium Greene1014_15]TSD08437.1 MAG: hypothetical protein Greene07144_67 [Parcubacteria group bacterium Greene0714_4]
METEDELQQIHDIEKGFALLHDMSVSADIISAKTKLLAELATEPKTLDGTPLSQLGKGLRQPGVETLLCMVCQKAGYIENKRPVMANCPECHGAGTRPQTFECFPCQGSGKFTQWRTGRIVRCRVCKGSGRFTSPTLTQACQTCLGHKTVPIDNQFVVDYVKCSKCQGMGETKAPFKPVFNDNTRQKLLQARERAATSK